MEITTKEFKNFKKNLELDTPHTKSVLSACRNVLKSPKTKIKYIKSFDQLIIIDDDIGKKIFSVDFLIPSDRAFYTEKVNISTLKEKLLAKFNTFSPDMDEIHFSIPEIGHLKMTRYFFDLLPEKAKKSIKKRVRCNYLDIQMSQDDVYNEETSELDDAISERLYGEQIQSIIDK